MGRQRGDSPLNHTESLSRDERDRAEIIDVIEEESAAWYRGDVEGWRACWVQDERAQHMNARPKLGARLLYGFDAIETYFTPIFRSLSTERLLADDIRRENWRISIGTDMAWVTFDQLTPLSALSDAAPGRHNQMRVLEKAAGSWKIVAIFQIPNRIGYYQSPWVRVDRNARIIEMAPGADEALLCHGSLKVVGKRLCARRVPDNTKLREALAEADDQVRRLKARAPVALVLNGAEEDQISLCWVTIADMIIVVLIDDERLLTDSIAAAGVIYQLSAAQVRVAEAIARGNDLSVTARILGVQPSTVRTHVRRMFERVDVKSQPALIRALLSVDPPRS